MNKNEIPTILIVDDKEANLLAMEMHFEDMPLSIVKASSGNEALVTLLEHDFAAVLMDVQMPGMDGFEAAQIMRSNKNTAQVPIIFVTAISKEEKHVFKGYDSGAVDYIFKPLDPEILKAKVKIFLDLYNQKKEVQKANSKLNHANIELEKANHTILEQQEKVVEEERLKVLLNMAGATAHELNQPLTVLLGNIELIDLCQNEPDKIPDLLDRIKNAGHRISEVVKKIQTIRHYEIQPHDHKTNIINFDQDVHILCIEDSSEDFMDIEKSLASRKDICLSHTKSLKESWTLINQDKNSRIDLIFLDFILPDGNGFDFLMELTRKDMQIPVVAITGQGNDAVSAKLIQAGALDYLPKSKISEQSLSRIITNAVENAKLKNDLIRMQEKLVQTSTKDALTGLFNRRYLLESLESEIKRAKRYNENLSFLIIDIDHFKKINDTYGHPTGDTVLAGVAKILTKSIRHSDLAGRLGGEEFAIILPHTNIKEGLVAAQKIRKAVEQAQFTDKEDVIKVTISIGVTICSDTDITLDMIKHADKALYMAKENGRNQVKVMSS